MKTKMKKNDEDDFLSGEYNGDCLIAPPITPRITPLPRRLHGHRSYGIATARMTQLSRRNLDNPLSIRKLKSHRESSRETTIRIALNRTLLFVAAHAPGFRDFIPFDFTAPKHHTLLANSCIPACKRPFARPSVYYNYAWIHPTIACFTFGDDCSRLSNSAFPLS